MKLRGIHPGDSGHSFRISSLKDRKMKDEELDLNLVKGQIRMLRKDNNPWRARKSSLSSQGKQKR